MSFNKICQMPSGKEILDLLPLENNLKIKKNMNDKNIINIIEGKSEKLLLIVGPCSVDNKGAIFDYLDKLKYLAQQVYDKILIVPRVYSAKPRTMGTGYKGMVHQNKFDGQKSMKQGILSVRKLHMEIIKTYDFGIADELLYTFSYPYFEDLISYIAIGARSVENQHHRILTSGIDVCVGMKNSTSGNIKNMLNAIYVSQNKHNFIYNGYEVDTTGNKYAHAVLRGGNENINDNDINVPNYNYEKLLKTISLYNKYDVLNKSIIVDCSHANSNKEHSNQIKVAKNVIKSIKRNSDIKSYVKGLMLESYIQGGQDTSGKSYGKSITDACLSFEDTKNLVLDIADLL